MISTRITLDDDMLCATFRRFDGVGHVGSVSPDSLREVVGDSVEGQHVHTLLEDHVTYPDFVDYMCEGAALVSCSGDSLVPVCPGPAVLKESRSCCSASPGAQTSCSVQ